MTTTTTTTDQRLARKVPRAMARGSLANLTTTSPPGRTGDPLAEALQHLRMEGVFYCRSELSAPFAAHLPPMPDCLWFHVAVRGGCWIVDRAGGRHRLRQGELAVLPHGAGHDLVSDDAPKGHRPSVFDLEREYVTPRYAVLRYGGGGAPVDLVCGSVRLAHPAARQLVEVLPDLLHVASASAGGVLATLPALLEVIATETAGPRPGGEAVVTRLCDVLVVGTVREWIERDPAARRGWLGALRDPQIGQAVAAVHRAPERAWTVAELAGLAAMSRSSFSARFTELVGCGPMAYVARWRMNVATDLLTGEGPTVARVAERLGYASEAAFGRAYKRATGVPPGVVRRRAREELAEIG